MNRYLSWAERHAGALMAAVVAAVLLVIATQADPAELPARPEPVPESVHRTTMRAGVLASCGEWTRPPCLTRRTQRAVQHAIAAAWRAADGRVRRSDIKCYGQTTSTVWTEDCATVTGPLHTARATFRKVNQGRGTIVWGID